MLDHAGLPEKGSNRAYDSRTIIEGFIVSVILGAKHLVHSYTIRHDEVIRQIFGWKGGMASPSTFCRFAKRSSLENNEVIMRRFTGDGSRQPDEPVQTTGHGREIISESGYR